MNAKDFDFWQDHSKQFLEMAFRADHCEIIEHHDGYGKRTGACKDTVEIYLAIRGAGVDRIWPKTALTCSS